MGDWTEKRNRKRGIIRSCNLWISASKQNLDRTVNFGYETVGSSVPTSNTKWKVNNVRKSNVGLECRHFLKLEIYFCPSANKDNPWPIQGFPGGSEVKASACNAGDLVWSVGQEGNGNPLQYSCLENPMDGEAWWATVHRVEKSQTQLKQLSIHART